MDINEIALEKLDEIMSTNDRERISQDELTVMLDDLHCILRLSEACDDTWIIGDIIYGFDRYEDSGLVVLSEQGQLSASQLEELVHYVVGNEDEICSNEPGCLTVSEAKQLIDDHRMGLSAASTCGPLQGGLVMEPHGSSFFPGDSA